MLVALMSTPDRWPSGSPHAQIKVIVVELAARARDRAGEAGHECRFAGEELVALVERLIDKITIPISVCSPRTRGDTTKATTQKELAYFNPLPSCEGRLADLSRSHYCFRFQSTPLMRGETTWEITRADIGDISIHSPHARGDENGVGTNGRPNNFNPLPSCEGRPHARSSAKRCAAISIHSPHARGDPVMAQFHGFDTISIHSPHARGDESLQSYIVRYLISIHSPHARGDGRFIRTGGAWDISIHSPHARGDKAVHWLRTRRRISIHSPHARGDEEPRANA